MAYQPTDWEHGDIITGGKLNKIEQELTHVADNATYGFGGAQLSSDGLTPFSYINAGDPMPANPQKGDTVFLKDGNDFLIYSYNSEDWVLKVDPDLSNRIEETIKTASDNTDKAIADNNTQINETINQVAKEQADLAVKDGDFNNKAQAMADKALQDAKNNTATVAKSTLDTANQNIADAKKSVTDDIAQEASDRATAVSALDTKAQGYANDAKNTATDGIAQEAKDRATAISTVDKNAKGYADQAKSDAVDAATNADGVINKKIDDTASSITSTVSQNKKDADGKITTAQSTATQALNGLSTKVERTEYNQKTGDLSAQINATTATATQSKQDIIDIKSSNNTQDSKINSIISDATKTQQSISDIKKSQGTQSDKLNQITTDVNGTKQNITDIQTKDGQQDTRMGTIESSVSGVRSDFSTYQRSNDGAVKTAQTTAQTAVDGLSNKVSQSDYNAKTGQLSTDVTNVTQTANQAKTDIASIKQTDTSQDARMTTIEADASGTKTTVSNLQKTQNTQSGSISTLQQLADGFDATVTKINNVVNSLGQTNQLFNTEFSPDFEGWYEVDNGYELSSQVPTYDGSNVVHIKTANTDYDWLRQKIPVVPGQVLSFSTMMKFAPTSPDDSTVYWRYSINFYKSSGGSSLAITYGKQNFQALDWTLQKSENIVAPADAAYVTINYYMRGAGEAWLAKPMLVFESTVGQYVQGNYNNNDALAKVKLTAEQAALDLSNYKTDADGRISKAQTDIVATAKDVTTKVSQIDYNAKTGDLSTSVSKAQQTADSAVTTIGNYKTSNDNRVKATETSIAQNTKDITLRATSTDLNSAKSDYNAQIAQVNVNANAITSQVSSIQTKINSMGQVNQLANTEFNPDMSGWFSKSGYPSISQSNGDVSPKITPLYGSGVSDSNAVKIDTSKDSASTYTLFRQVVRVTPGSVFSLSWEARTEQSNQYSNLWIRFQNEASTATVSEILVGDWSKDKDGSGSVSSTWRRITNKKATNIMVPDNATYVLISFESREGMIQYLSQPMLVFGSTVGDYVPGAYNSNDKVAVQQVTIDGITDIVSKQGTNIDSVTKRVQTAEGTLSTATNNISGLKTSVTQTANQVTQEISDRTKGDSNTLQSSKDFTTSSVSSAVTGVNSTITQTSDSLIAKINTKTDSDTVLSLLKNNWSIGITDNISKITSGIVGNASQMSLISKKVVIDSPNTQIKGTAWINSAMIANGAIGSAQIGDATITSAKIATLDVAKLTGNVSNFIQSNWNGLYQSVKISPIGMTISTSQGSTAQFNQDGLVLDGALGTTNVLNGQIELISSSNEYLGTFQHETMPDHSNVDYLMIKLAGWHTSNPGDSDYDINSAGTNTIRGGDGIGFGVTNNVGTYDMKMSWDSSLVAGYKGRKAGWHVEDIMTWHQPTYFEGGFDVAQQFSSTDRRALHIQGSTLSNGHKWFGFFDTPSKAGFGTDDTNDVLFYMKGKSYSLYTMLSKLNML
ncbi:hypothetical protein [Leuconostoc mesenteroides]|uniref:hypothetical protein n=1 Tax=Leuconostoc mesenteroides TaxID=1245 RepID=UPI00386EF84F